MARNRQLPNGEVRGRDTRLNPVIASAIIRTLESGAYATTTCKYVGLAYSTYQFWKARGSKEMDRVRSLGYEPDEIVASVTTSVDENGKIETADLDWLFKNLQEPFSIAEWPFVVFYSQTEKARAKAELRAISTIQTAGNNGQWQAYAWFLERVFYEKYGRRDRVALEGAPDGNPIQMEVSSVASVEEKIRQLRGSD